MEELTNLQCPMCGVHYAIPSTMYDWNKGVRKDAKDRGWSCPNGHRLVVRDSDAEEQRRRADRAEQENARLQDEINAEKHRTVAAKAALTKHKKRSAAGTCPCCKRTFQNMAAHMQNKHPDFVAEQGTRVVPIKRKKASNA